MSALQRPLTKAEADELDVLNDAVTAAIERRRKWLDAKMHECSRLKVGDDIYDVHSGARLGRVTELYRYWRDDDEGVRDNSAHCDYRYETGRNCFDNTSRQIGRTFGTLEDAASYAEIRAAGLRGEASA